MHQHQELTPPKSDRSSPTFSIVSRFCIKDSTFLVVSLQDQAESETALDQPINSNTAFPFLGQFSYGGNHHAIISAQTTLEDVDSSRINLLTARELQVAALVALGRSNKQVSTQLQISEWTVSAHLRRIFVKLNVDSRAAMVYKCAPLIEHLHQFKDPSELMNQPIKHHS